MLRVNSTAHAAAVMLMGDQNRDQMWADWKRLVNLKRIIESELPHSCGHEEVYNILNTEIRSMLLPLKTEMWLPDGSYFQESVEESPDMSNETVIDRIAAFLTRLPSRFPHVPARTILHCVNALGSAALREITVENGASFQGWWLTKVFIDEMGQWLASLGGFLEHSPPDFNSPSYSPVIGESVNNDGSGSNNESRYSSIDVEFGSTQAHNHQSFLTNGNGPMSATGISNPECQSWNSLQPPYTQHSGILTNASRPVSARQYAQQYEQVSFNMDLDLGTSQQESNHDDSGIALLDDPIDSKYAPHMHQTYKQHSSHHGMPTGSS
jgi:regulatory factor X